MNPGIRSEQKEATRRRIADQAARLFGENGFERTSVRQIAAAAGVDPALVLYYFGSKRALLRDVMGEPADVDPATVTDPVEFVLDGLVAKLDDHATAALAQLRSMLTNADAREHARDQLRQFAGLLSERLDGDHRAARANLLLATTLGIAVARELLEVEALTELDPPEIAELLRPAVVELVHR
jgi:AcrR family transcriptional regulator